MTEYDDALDVAPVERAGDYPPTEPQPTDAQGETPAPVSRPRSAAGDEHKPKEMRRIVELIDLAMVAPLPPMVREALTKARQIADEVVDGRTVSTEATTAKRRRASTKTASKKAPAKKAARKRR